MDLRDEVFRPCWLLEANQAGVTPPSSQGFFWDITRTRDPTIVDPQIVEFPCDKDPKKVPLNPKS